MNIHLHSEHDTAAFAQRLAQILQAGDVVFLEGELGAGKTTFTRHLAHALGVTGRIKSPTYTLVESYELTNGTQLHHFDLYRLAEPREWFSAGFDEYLNPNSIALIEWPSQAAGALPSANLTLFIAYDDDVEGARNVALQYDTTRPSYPRLIALTSTPV
jgi:tRNA threonylcarbamoyladenosine biosynthesis protein TsaE